MANSETATKRATKVVKTRRYKITKRHPKRPRAVLKMDLGTVEQQIALIFPENAKYLNVSIPKERNPNRIDISLGTVRLSFYLDEEKGFVFDSDGVYVGKFSKIDLKKAWFLISRLLLALKKRKFS